jgi:hypothetical protein
MMRIYAIVLAVAGAISCSSGSRESTPAAGGRKVFEDTFDRTDIGADWLDTSSGRYSIVDGRLRVQGARNKPLWLKRKLPRDCRVEFTARSESPAVDIKVEVFGDGRSFAKRASYTATSYVVILGGWNNSRSIIARMDEHGSDRKVRTSPKGETGRVYRFSIARKGGGLNWFLDGEPFLDLDDGAPLAGAGHEHFAFNNWASEVFFDDFAVYEI